MNTPCLIFSLALLAGGPAFAQQTQNQSTSPEAASSPHQRQATGETTQEEATTQGSEPDAAASPHQREVTDASKSPAAGPIDAATFVSKAAQGGMTEVALAKAAQSKASDTAVRAFADRMIKDHGKANDELAAIAKRNSMQVPASLDSTHQALVDKMSAKSGKDFDSAYSTQMVKDHHETIALFQSATKLGNADLAGFASKTLPTLKEHDAMAQKLPGQH